MKPRNGLGSIPLVYHEKNQKRKRHKEERMKKQMLWSGP
jgi:hypothetical protein